MSWPPTTRFSQEGSPRPVNGARSVTQPVGSISPARSASSPVTAVVATEPRAPTNHNPVGSFAPIAHPFQQR
jgi:hypothetical protein